MTAYPITHHVQAAYLHDAVGVQVRVLLLYGTAITGELLDFDQFSLLVLPKGEPAAVLVYKHAIAAVSRVDAAA